MLRATQMASEETLPIMGQITATAPPFDEIESQPMLNNLQFNNNQHISNKNYQRKDRLSYGLTNILPSFKVKYPIAVIFVLTTKFFEAFAANGIRTILALFLYDDLNFSQQLATIMLHVFNFFGQFCPIFGAILADSYWGNIRTISVFCYLYATGWLLLIITSMPSIGISVILLVSISLLFIAIGNGSIRACITSLGALQFKIPQQSKQLAAYFSWYYFVYYFGIFLSKILPPMLRANTKCFHKSDCYPAVFGSLCALFLASWGIFSLGKYFYKSEKLSDENILVKCYGCIKYAIIRKFSKANKTARPAYWLHNARGRYDEQFINDLSRVLKITKLFIPLVVYFALLAQQDSSWTFQASVMNCTIAGYTIQPDQAKGIGPIFLFILIPTFQYIVTPLLKHYFAYELNPLHSVTLGGIFSASSFLAAGVLQQYIIDNTYKSVNVVWQIPQFLLLMLGELLLSIPGLQFAFTQAPESMKSVVTAGWFLNNAFGNLIVVIISEINIFSTQSSEYFFYAVAMIIAIIIFTCIAYDFLLNENERNNSNSDTTHLLANPKYYRIETDDNEIIVNRNNDNIINNNNNNRKIILNTDSI